MTKTLNPAKAELVGYVSNPLIQILRAEARDKMFTGEKVVLEVGNPVRKLAFEPLWLVNSREQVIDYHLRTYISYTEYNDIMAKIKETKEMVTKLVQTARNQPDLEQLKIDIEQGLKQIDEGKTVDGREAFDRIKNKVQDGSDGF